MTTDPNRATTPFVRSRTPETSLAYMGSVLTFLLSNDDTGGDASVFTAIARAGSEPPPHVHLYEDETYYILEGELEFHVEGEEATLIGRTGDLVFLPRQKAHAFRYRTPLAHVIVTLHAGDGHPTSEGYFKAMAARPAESLEAPDLESGYGHITDEQLRDAADLAEKNGIHLLSREETEERLPGFIGSTPQA